MLPFMTNVITISSMARLSSLYPFYQNLSVKFKITQMFKILKLPPLLVNGQFVSDFCTKANLFNNFFVSICTPVKNSSVLPLFSYRTNARITLFHFAEEDISLIKNLGPAKACGCGNISIKMIKICDESLLVPLRIIQKLSLN